MPQVVLEERKALRDLLDADLWRESTESVSLYNWVHRATVAYLASGCDPQALAQEAPEFVRVVHAFFESEREAEQEYVDDRPDRISGDSPEGEAAIAKKRRHVAALGRLLERLDGRAPR